MNCSWLTVPLRKSPTAPAAADPSIKLDAPPLDSLLVKRRAMLTAQQSMESLLTHASSKSIRDAGLAEMIAHLEAYLSAAGTAVKGAPAALSSVYYFWTASLGPEVHVAICDVRYDLAMAFYNLAAAHHNVAIVLALEADSERAASAAGKETYRLLCEAAGHWGSAKTLAGSVGASHQGMLMFDATAKFCGAMEAASLAHAQEVSATLAAHNETTKLKPTVAGLCTRVAQLYTEVLIGVTGTSAPLLEACQRLVSVKIPAYRALALAYQARSTMDADPRSGLRLMAQSQGALREAQRITEASPGAKTRKSIITGCKEVVSEINTSLTHFNDKVYFATAAQEDVPIAQAIAMAQPKRHPLSEACAAFVASIDADSGNPAPTAS